MPAACASSCGRALGFSLEQVARLLRLLEHGGSACAETRALARVRLDDIDRKIADLDRLAGALRHTLARCGEGRAEGCPILDQLSR